MTEVICPNCDKEISVESGRESPAECPYCFEDLNPSAVARDVPAESGEVAGLTLIYQINQQRIEIPASEKVVLGRNSFGANVLSNIFFNGKQVVSRQHCSIEFRENKFYLQDEGSLNGTFYGANKIDCKKGTQVIENGSLIYLGEEPFVAQIRFRSPDEGVRREPVAKIEEVATARKYRCNEPTCGYESESFHSVCPDCSTFNSLIPIED